MNQVKMDSRTIRSQAGDYTVRIENGSLAKIPGELGGLGFDRCRVGLISNPTVRRFHADRLGENLRTSGFEIVNFDFPEGESYKNLASVSRCLDHFLEAKWERHNPFLIVGGGVVGDMGAFSASILLRGIPLFHVPTTVVAQVDSSIGGKTGVDHREGKNLIGTFYPPKAVWIDPETLETLPVRERRSGLAEVIKYALIGDYELLSYLDRNLTGLSGESFDPEIWFPAIQMSVRDKGDIVSKDEKEAGLRMNLNFGHTFGHALEAALGYEGILHGEAVALGMLSVTRIGEKLGITEKGTFEIVRELLAKARLPVKWPDAVPYPGIEPFLKNDKKTRDGKVTLILPVSPGRVTQSRDYDTRALPEGVAL
jgi:3-dehydroquinate synthase